VVKEICSWLQPFRPSNQDGSQEHNSLINNSSFDDFAFIVQFKYKWYISSRVYLIRFSFMTGHCCMCVFCKKTLFSILILGSVFRDYVIFYGDSPFPAGPTNLADHQCRYKQFDGQRVDEMKFGVSSNSNSFLCKTSVKKLCHVDTVTAR